MVVLKKIFLTFADQRMSRALQRIHNQAIAMGVYDFIVLANENSLDLQFREQFSEHLKPGICGFGYWSWKAQIILQTLRQMNDGDILQYTDAGCHLNPSGRKRLEEYFLKAQNSESGILAFQAIPPTFHNGKIELLDLRESRWCKGDLCDALAVRSKLYIMDTQTIGAGIIFIKKCNESMRIISSWLDVYKNNYNLIDDSKSKSENPPGFVAHRHDQSIFSILAKLNKIETISAYEYWYPNGRKPSGPDWKILKEYPIHAKRDRGVHWASKVYALPGRVFKKILKIMNRGNSVVSD
jgi:hypothetical protein